MVSLPAPPLSFQFNSDPAPQQKVNAAQLDTQLVDIFNWASQLTTILNQVLRPDNQITDQTIRLFCLHPEILSVIGSQNGAVGYGWQPLVAAQLATTGANLVLSGEQTIDGVLTSVSRVLVKDQTTPSQNGLYTTGPGAWVRTTDATTGAQLGYGIMPITQGLTNAGAVYICNVPSTTLVIGTSNVTFVKMFNPTGVGQILAGGTGATSPGAWPTARRLACRVVAVANINLAAPGATIDGVALSAGDRMLLTAQVTQSQNGPWIFNGAAVAASRPLDYPSTGTLQAFLDLELAIREGTIYAGGVWRLTTAGAITIDTSATAWVECALPSILATGTTTRRSAGTRFADKLNLRDFGAVGDGVTDDTAAVNAAIAQSFTAGTTLYFPPGTFLVQPINITQVGVVIELDRKATLKAKAVSATSLINVTGSGFRMSGGQLDCTLQAGGDGITIQADDCRVRDTKISNAFACGIKVAGANKSRIEACEVISSGNVGIFAVVTTANISEIVIINNRVDRSSIAAGSIVEGGIKVHGLLATYSVSEVEVSGNTVLMPVSPAAPPAICIEVWGFVNRATISHNRTQGGYMGISCDHTNDSAVTGNSVYNPSSIGIEVASGTFTSVTGNSIYGNALPTDGITIDGAVDVASNISISGNVIRGCLTSGIHVSPGVSANDITITGNTIYHAGTYGINVALTTGFVISGNIIAGTGVNALKAIMLDTSSQGTVTGNTMSNWTQNGVLIYTAAAGKVIDYIIITGNAFISCNVSIGYSFTGGSTLGTNGIWQANSYGFQASSGLRTVTAAYTSQPMTDRSIRCDATAGAFAILLPAGQIPSGYEMIIKKVDATANAITLTGTVDGVVNPTITAQYQTMRIRWNSATWENW